jgi:hypothetical protein
LYSSLRKDVLVVRTTAQHLHTLSGLRYIRTDLPYGARHEDPALAPTDEAGALALLADVFGLDLTTARERAAPVVFRGIGYSGSSTPQPAVGSYVIINGSVCAAGSDSAPAVTSSAAATAAAPCH